MMGEQERRCALTGLPFGYSGEGDDIQMRPSLDRIDSDGHYAPQNVLIVVRFTNWWKSANANPLARRLLRCAARCDGRISSIR